MNINKADKIVNRINEIVRRWPEFAEETKVKPNLRDAINKTLIDLNA